MYLYCKKKHTCSYFGSSCSVGLKHQTCITENTHTVLSTTCRTANVMILYVVPDLETQKIHQIHQSSVNSHELFLLRSLNNFLHLCLSESVLVEDVHSLINNHQTNFSSRISSYLQHDLISWAIVIIFFLHLKLELLLIQDMLMSEKQI